MPTNSPNFHRAWVFCKEWECVFDRIGNVICEDVPGDGGGLTKYGVDQSSHPHVNIRALTDEEAAQIYHDGEWVRCRCDELPPNLGLALFDFAVTSGMSPAVKALQEILGQKEDGWIGPLTLAAATATKDADSFLFAYKTDREAFYASVAAEHAQDRKFLRGWRNRAEDLVHYVARYPLAVVRTPSPVEHASA